MLCCEALEGTKELYTFTVLEHVFKDFGLPFGDPHRQMIDAKVLRTQVIAGLVLMALAAVNFVGSSFRLSARVRLRHTKRVELLSKRRRTYARCCFSAAVTRGTLAAS